MRSALVNIAWAASRTKGTFYSARFHKIKSRRGGKRAAIAIAHSILKSVYHVLKNGEPYHELGAEHLKQLAKTKRTNYFTAELRKMGFEVLLTDTQSVS